MDTEEFNKYVEERYRKELEWYDTNSQLNKKNYRILQWILIVFSSLTPVFIVADFIIHDVTFFIPSLVSSIIVGICGTVMRTFKYYDNWLNYRTISETLKKEFYLYQANLDEYAETDNKESIFVKRVESLISRENTLWITTIKQEQEVDSTK